MLFSLHGRLADEDKSFLFMKNFSAVPIILAVALFLPFEGYFSYLLGGEGVLAVAIKLAPEVLIAFTLGAALLLPRQNRLMRSPIDSHLVLLIALAVFSTLLYAESTGAAANNFRALFRYVAVFYLVYYFGFSIKSWRLLLSLMVVVVSLNVAFALFQYVLGDSYPDVLRVNQKIRVALENIYEVQQVAKDEKIGAVQALFESPGVFGVFLIVAIVFVQSRLFLKSAGQWYFVALLLLILVSAFLTYSKTAFLLTVLAVAIFWYQYFKRWRGVVVAIAFTASISGFIAFSVFSAVVDQSFAKREEVAAVDNLMNLMSSQYWDHFFQAERGWVLKEVGGEIIGAMPIIGYSPDEDAVKARISSLSDGRLARLIYYSAFEDVYWVALLGYFGLIGMGVFFSMFFALYKEGKYLLEMSRDSGDSSRVVLSAGFLTLLLIAVPYCFFERALEINVFAFYFWLFAGVVARQSWLIRQKGLAA